MPSAGRLVEGGMADVCIFAPDAHWRVEPVSLQFAFEVQTRNTFLDGVALVIQETPLIAFCHTCQAEYSPEIGIQYACPTCNSPMDDIRSGRELKIDRVECAVPS